MARRTCEEYKSQEDGKEHSAEDEVRRRKKNFQGEAGEENPREENGISNRLFSSTFIPPLANTRHDTDDRRLVKFIGWIEDKRLMYHHVSQPLCVC